MYGTEGGHASLVIATVGLAGNRVVKSESWSAIFDQPPGALDVTVGTYQGFAPVKGHQLNNIFSEHDVKRMMFRIRLKTFTLWVMPFFPPQHPICPDPLSSRAAATEANNADAELRELRLFRSILLSRRLYFKSRMNLPPISKEATEQ